MFESGTQEILSVTELASVLGLHRNTIRTMVNDGRLPEFSERGNRVYRRAGRRIMFVRAGLRDLFGPLPGSEADQGG